MYRKIHTTMSCCVPFWDTIFTTNWCATWGLKLDSKDVQGRVSMKIEAITITLNGNTQHFIFKHVKHTFECILLSTCLCYLFPFSCVFCFKIYGLQESIFHCSLLVLNHDVHQ